MKKFLSIVLRAHLALAFLFAFALQTFAQTRTPSQPRITSQVDEGKLVVLKGNTHPLAQARNDQGLAPDSLPMGRMLMVLQRSSEQESALRKLMDQQQTNPSPNFHQWLTPEQFGQQFGVADADIQSVTSWLSSHGFQVNQVSAGKMIIEFSGTAGQIRNAFHTEIHKFVVNGEEHWANASDPQIPAALAPVIAGVNTMHNFRKKPAIHTGRVLPMPETSGQGTPQFTTGPVPPCNINTSSPNPIFSNTCFGLGPADFAKVYNVPASADGTGQTVAVIGDSDICTVGGSQTVLPAGCLTDDVVAFRTLFGLGANNTQVFVDGSDPGLNSDETEGVLDVEWVGAVAKKATVLFVVAASTEASAGIDLAAERVVDNNLAGVMTESFGACESSLGNSGNQFYDILWEQAAAQGITVIIATGDSGSADCDNGNTESSAQNGANVNGLASTPFDVAVGGTDFDFNAAGYPAAFWDTTATTGLTAKGYIPETAWNDSCGQSTFGNCKSLPANESFLENISAGGGGQSSCIVMSGPVCTQAYSKPPWQVGTGVPSDGVRDLPDLSLFAAPGLSSNSFYVVCESDLTAPSSSCTGLGSEFIPVGGTSASVQSFGGIMALVNQAMAAAGKSPRQGDANYELYPLFAAQIAASLSCNSSSSPGSGCTFNDTTKGTNSVFCVTGSPNCNSTTLTLTTLSSGVPTSTPAFATGAGFDLATGLGSVNVTNLVQDWVTGAASFAPTTTTFCLSKTATASTNCAPTQPFTFPHGTQIFVNAAVTSAIGPAIGDVSLIGSNTTFPPNNSPTAGVDHFDAVTGNADIYTLTNGSITGAFTNELVGGTYTITAHYAGFNNGGTGKLFGASDSTGIPVIITPEASTTSISLLDFNLITSGVANLNPGASVPYGSALAIRVDVVGTSSGFETGTGNINVKDSSVSMGLFPLNSEGYMEFDTPMFNFPQGNLPQVTTFPALAVQGHSLTASFPGDPSYSASSTASPFLLTVIQAPTFSTISGPSTTSVNTPISLTVLVDTTPNPLTTEGSLGNSPTVTVTFFNGVTQLGNPVPVTATLDSNGFAAAQATMSVTLAASASITAKYSGDTNYLASTSPAFSVTVTGAADFTLSATAPNPNPVTITTPGQTGSSVITVSALNGFTGTVTLTCSVAPQNLTDPPGCAFTAPGTVTLTNATTSGTDTLMVSTTKASALWIKPIGAPHEPFGLMLTGALAAALFAVFLVIRFSSSRRRFGYAVIAIVLLTTGLAVVGCGGGGGGGGGGGDPGTTPGPYTVTVTGTSGSTVHTVMVTVNVQ